MRRGGHRQKWPHALGPVFELHDQAFGPAADLSRESLFAGLVTYLQRSPSLAVVVIEDLHWADEATLDFVRYLGRRIAHARVLLLATFRDDETGPTHPLRRALGDLSAAHVSRLQLAPLSLAAVTQWAAAAGQRLRMWTHCSRLSASSCTSVMHTSAISRATSRPL